MRKVREKTLDTRTARAKLPARGKPYYRALGPAVHLGYRKGATARRWVARIYLGEGRYKVFDLGHTDDIADADGVIVLDFWQAQAAAQQLVVEKRTRSSRFTVQQAIDEYVEQALDGKQAQHATRHRLAAYVPQVLLQLELADLTTELLETWLKDMAKAPPRAPTAPGAPQNYRTRDAGIEEAEHARRRRASANRLLGMFRAACNFAFRRGRVASDSAWRRVKPFRSVDSTVARYLTVAESQRLVNAADLEFKPTVQAALLTGARFAELMRLKAGDFNPDAGTLQIKRSKSGKARYVILSEEGVAFFRQRVAGMTSDEPMLPFIRDTAAADLTARACERAHITPKVRFHDLRHTWASLAVMAGMPLMVVARSLGHADLRMVTRCYGHLEQGYMTDTVRTFAPRFGIVEQFKIKSLR